MFFHRINFAEDHYCYHRLLSHGCVERINVSLHNICCERTDGQRVQVGVSTLCTTFNVTISTEIETPTADTAFGDIRTENQRREKRRKKLHRRLSVIKVKRTNERINMKNKIAKRR